MTQSNRLSFLLCIIVVVGLARGDNEKIQHINVNLQYAVDDYENYSSLYQQFSNYYDPEAIIIFTFQRAINPEENDLSKLKDKYHKFVAEFQKHLILFTSSNDKPHKIRISFTLGFLTIVAIPNALESDAEFGLIHNVDVNESAANILNTDTDFDIYVGKLVGTICVLKIKKLAIIIGNSVIAGDTDIENKKHYERMKKVLSTTENLYAFGFEHFKFMSTNHAKLEFLANVMISWGVSFERPFEQNLIPDILEKARKEAYKSDIKNVVNAKEAFLDHLYIKLDEDPTLLDKFLEFLGPSNEYDRDNDLFFTDVGLAENEITFKPTGPYKRYDDNTYTKNVDKTMILNVEELGFYARIINSATFDIPKNYELLEDICISNFKPVMMNYIRPLITIEMENKPDLLNKIEKFNQVASLEELDKKFANEEIATMKEMAKILAKRFSDPSGKRIEEIIAPIMEVQRDKDGSLEDLDKDEIPKPVYADEIKKYFGEDLEFTEGELVINNDLLIIEIIENPVIANFVPPELDRKLKEVKKVEKEVI